MRNRMNVKKIYNFHSFLHYKIVNVQKTGAENEFEDIYYKFIQ